MKKAGRLAAVLAAVLLALPFLALPTLQGTVPVDLSPVQPAAESIVVSAQPVSLPAAPTNHIAGNEDNLDAALDEIHLKEKQLQRLDDLRYKMHAQKA